MIRTVALGIVVIAVVLAVLVVAGIIVDWTRRVHADRTRLRRRREREEGLFPLGTEGPQDRT